MNPQQSYPAELLAGQWARPRPHPAPAVPAVANPARPPAAPRPVRPPRPAIPEVLTPDEVADALRVSRMTVYRLIHDGDLKALRVGRSFRIPTRELREYLRLVTP